ncbi:MAG: hypothetical protein JO106_05200 [Mycobacterium sp.]|nr:hypothetical protein [Mycobacterium sp.]
MSSMTMNRPAANLDNSAAAPGTADQRQADYFLRVLTEYRLRIDNQIDKYQRMIAMCEANGDVHSARGVRHNLRIEKQDRQILGGLIYRLQQRFAVHAPSEGPPVARTARLVVR